MVLSAEEIFVLTSSSENSILSNNMQTVIPGQTNTVSHDLIKKADCEPITTGTVTFTLIANSGANAGKWWNSTTALWSATEVSAGAGVHKAAGTWQCSIVSVAWSYGVSYLLSARESGDLQINYSELVVPSLAIGAVGTGDIEWVYTVTDSETPFAPIADVEVWVTTDLVGDNVIYSSTTNALGQVTFYLAAGTYYVWRQKAGYVFVNPDTEVVS
jgi:hypothetical protein